MAQSDESSGARPGEAEAGSRSTGSALYDTAYPKALRCAERKFLKKRPKWLDEKKSDPQKQDNKASAPPQLVGFGLSGGGIRSATFCLGVFQGLAKLSLLGEIDYISSVSGGSYFASFYGRLFTRRDIFKIGKVEKILSPDQAKRSKADEPDDASLDEAQHEKARKDYAWKTKVFDWMRENGRFLAPKGGGDLLIGIATVLRNWLTVQLVIGVSVMAILLAAQLLRVGLEWPCAKLIAWFRVPSAASCAVGTAQGSWWWSPYLKVAGAMAVFWVVPPGAAYWLFHLPEAAPPDERPPGQANLIRRAARAVRWPLSLTRTGVSKWATVALLVFFAAAGVVAGAVSGRPCEALGAAGLCFIFTFAFAVWAAGVASGKVPPLTEQSQASGHRLSETVENDLARCDEVRNRLSAMLRTALTATLATLAFGLIDSAGQMLYARHFCTECYRAEWLGALYGALAAVAPFAHWAAGSLSPNKKRRHLPVSLSLLAGIGAALVIVPALIGLDMFSHAVAYGFQKPTDAPQALMTSSRASPVEILLRVEDSTASREQGPAGPTGAVLTPAPRTTASAGPKAPPSTGGRAAAEKTESKGNAAPVTSARLNWPATFSGGPGNGDCRKKGARNPLPLAVALLFAAAFSYFAGGARRKGTSGATVFLNRTSLHPLYTARLIRAYLGASNKSRYGHDKAVSEVVAGDDISHERYWVTPEKDYYSSGAPLHLVNMTLNETIGGGSQVEQRDRKGLGMAAGPAGLSVGVRHHAVYQQSSDPEKILVQPFPPPSSDHEFRVFAYDNAQSAEFRGERLSLGNWTGVSGAAVSTGMGFRTSLGVSLITAFFNVRLGYWWDSGIESRTPSKKLTRKIGNAVSKLLPLQSYLIDEFLSRFHGTTRRLWYLSDGGNFENLGGYELIRRRLPLMIIIDAGADPDYDFDDLAGLVRKARLDFNAEIEFLDPDDKDKAELAGKLNKEVLKWYGPLEQLRRGRRADEPVPPAGTNRNVYFRSSNPARYSLKHAALARVRYLDGNNNDSTLILIKPTLLGDEPADVLQYHSSHPSFPHESTADQFFDEAQWESYRRLGQHIAGKLFVAKTKGGFLPKP